jgi:hypothetical protein
LPFAELRDNNKLLIDEIRRLRSLTLAGTVELIRQLDSIRVLPFPFVLFGKNLFEPVRLSRGDCLVREGGIMKDDELLTATITPKGAHLREMWCSLYRLTLLDRQSPHRLTFYLAVYPLFSPFWPPFPRELYTQQRVCFPVGDATVGLCDVLSVQEGHGWRSMKRKWMRWLWRSCT